MLVRVAVDPAEQVPTAAVETWNEAEPGQINDRGATENNTPSNSLVNMMLKPH